MYALKAPSIALAFPKDLNSSYSLTAKCVVFAYRRKKSTEKTNPEKHQIISVQGELYLTINLGENLLSHRHHHIG